MINKTLIKSYIELMRIDKPIGIWLLLIPCWLGIALATKGFPLINLLVLFAIGAVLMRSAGCIINDIVDRGFDAQVERTKNRPLASGKISIKQALVILALLLVLSLFVALLIGEQIIFMAFFALPLVITYPFMKRITWYPQLFLGLTFNFGALMGYVAVKEQIELSAILLYIGGIFWTLGYDTIYAHQDKNDDIKIGVKSTALKFGNESKKFIGIFYFLSILFWLFAGIKLIAIIAISIHFLWQLKTVNLDDIKSCNKIFRSNFVAGLLLFIGMII